MNEFKESQPNIEQSPAEVKVEKYEANSWIGIREQIMAIEDATFNNTGYGEGMMENLFEDQNNLNYLLKDSDGKIIGYTQALIDGDSAYIMNTAIKPEYQGKGNVGALMKDLELELRTRGVKWITRDSAVENGYADKIQKHYGERVVETRERMSPWGKQRHFKIEL